MNPFALDNRCINETVSAILSRALRFRAGPDRGPLIGVLPHKTPLGPVSGRWGQIDLHRPARRVRNRDRRREIATSTGARTQRAPLVADAPTVRCAPVQ